MVALETPICDFGWKAPDFNLKGIDQKKYSFSDIKGQNGTLVMFICNHCPYVKSVIGRIVEDCKMLQENGIGIIAIMSNDVNDPKYGHEDSFENMIKFSKIINSAFLMYMMKLRKQALPMKPSVLLTSLGLTQKMNSNIVED